MNCKDIFNPNILGLSELARVTTWFAKRGIRPTPIFTAILEKSIQSPVEGPGKRAGQFKRLIPELFTTIPTPGRTPIPPKSDF